jgi:hypothetical protein
MSLKSVLISGLALTLGLGVAVVGAETKNKPTTKPYALKTCVVSGDKLGDIGDIHIIQYKGREVRSVVPTARKISARRRRSTWTSSMRRRRRPRSHQPSRPHRRIKNTNRGMSTAIDRAGHGALSVKLYPGFLGRSARVRIQ